MKHGDHLGSNIDFDYLGDDDDDDATGGAVPPGFEAFATTDVGTAARVAGQAVFTFHVDPTATSAQTSGGFFIKVYGDSTAYVVSVATNDLDGWTQTGWTFQEASPDYYFNYFTKSSVSSGSTNLNFTVTTGEYAGDIFVSTSALGAPATAEATGVGNTVFCIIT